ncbi:immunity 49 family protein [Streptomyces sp. SL13]|uniref:Immunity 49 family protein n=1 Tax=Streptantibioticus silvisoli TaxID=2705255 RepID=A0AA90K8V3_9ACTN|nr:immunity 49 family protein [Streptantibioticus silvisoli]MDI5969942.1 immunity 49 family protein [Streptantibioticus silvisoli]
MTVQVPGHLPERADDTYVKRMREHVAENVARLEQHPRSFQRLFDQSGLYLRARLSLDPSGAMIESWEAMVVAMQVGSALFAAAETAQGTVRTRIDGEIRDIPAVGPQYFAHPGSWLTAFNSAIVCRDQPRMNRLCAFGPDLLRASEVTIDEFQYDWVDVLQTYWLERPGLVEKLTTTLETSHPDAARIAPRDLLDQQLYPPINLFHRFLRRDPQGFNEALVEALEAHRAYWTADEDRAESVEGSLALGPLAITCLAYDAGFPIEVESPYLPKYFLNREWLGEFPT